ncbi:MAG: GntR family transcriptional regulator [Hyphomicrobiales bacterium]|nr:MAG: GntR family transcriptional regulator [Hyphomicrobiales bacterium]
MSESTALSESVVCRVRTAILDGTFLPGTALREASLAQHYDVSRRTMREALLVLNGQGLVVHRHHSGASVRTFEAADIKDLYRVRRMLECEGVRHASDANEAALRSVHAAFARLEEVALVDGINSVRVAEADAAFHGAVIALSDSPRIDEFYQSIAAQMTHAITVQQRHDEANATPPERTIAEHRAIHDAVLDRNVYEAQRLALAHIEHYEAVLLAAAPTEAHYSRPPRSTARP